MDFFAKIYEQNSGILIFTDELRKRVYLSLHSIPRSHLLKLAGVTLFLLLLSVLGVLTDYKISQNAFALTPVADLTGQWSGFAQVSFSGTDCWTSGKVNGFFKQNENKMKTTYMESFHLFQQLEIQTAHMSHGK